MTSRLRIGAVLALGAVAACQDVSVTAVDVAAVAVTPPAADLTRGDTLRLTAVLMDGAGNTLLARAVDWSSDDPGVARVDGDGVVEGRGVGVVRIRASSGGAEGHATIEVLEPARIVLGDTEVRLAASPGQEALPAEVPVTNGGGGTLSGLRVTVSYPTGQPEGWLQAELRAATAPTTLVLRASAAGMEPGVYRAEVRVDSEVHGGDTRTLPVELGVAEGPPLLHLSPSTVGFVWEEGQSIPPPQTVSVSNRGGGSLSGLQASVAYESGAAPAWLAAELDGTTAPARLTLRVTAGSLAAGVHDATVRVSAATAGNSPQEVRVRLTRADPPPEIELTPGRVEWRIEEGEASPPARIVQVGNRGAGTLAGLTATVSYPPGGTTGWLSANLAGSSAPTELVLSLSDTELPTGSHEASVTVHSPDAVNSPRSVAVSLTVDPRVDLGRSSITASPGAIPASGRSTSLVTVQLRDPRGNPMPTGGAALDLTTSSGSLAPVTDHGGGRYSATLTSAASAGTAEVSARVGGRPLTTTATVEFTPSDDGGGDDEGDDGDGADEGDDGEGTGDSEDDEGNGGSDEDDSDEGDETGTDEGDGDDDGSGGSIGSDPACDIAGSTLSDDLDVAPGLDCSLSGVRIEGNLTLSSGSRLTGVDLEVDGNVQGDGAGTVTLSGSTILGNVQMEDGGDVDIRTSFIDGDIQLEGNLGSLVVIGNTVEGNVQATDNRRGPFTFSDNVIDGDLECEGNAPPPSGSGNTVDGDMEGQCADF